MREVKAGGGLGLRSAATIFRCFHAARRANVYASLGAKISDSRLPRAPRTRQRDPPLCPRRPPENFRRATGNLHLRATQHWSRGGVRQRRGALLGAPGVQKERAGRAGEARGEHAGRAQGAQPLALAAALWPTSKAPRVSSRPPSSLRERGGHDLIRSVSAIFAYNATFNAAKSFFQSKSRSPDIRDFS